MTLLTRISRLFRADFHALLDSIEEPDALLHQSLREMEEAVLGDELCEQRQKADLETLNRRRNELEKTSIGIAEELDICLAADKESLARSLIRKRLETNRLMERFAQQMNCLEKSLAELRARLKDQRERLDALRQKAALFDEEQRSPYSSAESPSQITPVSEDDIEIALLKEKQRRMPS